MRKLSQIRQQKEQEKAVPGEAVPESLVTWIFQDDFVPRAKITKEGSYSIMTDYLGPPVEAYDEEGILVWKRELDINGKVMPPGKDCYGRRMEETGDTGFIPFRFQGQYEDEETGLYYNRFRYYNPETGQYTQQDPIGLAGGNPTLYGYVWDTNWWTDPFGLFKVWRNLRPEETISEGLSAKIPGRNMSISGHIMNGSKHKGAQFISTTRNPDIAASWRELGQRTVMFDTDDVISDSLGNRNIIDVSTPEKAAAKGLKGRAYSRAVSSNEVLVEGRVPSDKIKVVCKG